MKNHGSILRWEMSVMVSKCKRRRQEDLLGGRFNKLGGRHLLGGRHGEEEEGAKSRNLWELVLGVWGDGIERSRRFHVSYLGSCLRGPAIDRDLGNGRCDG